MRGIGIAELTGPGIEIGIEQRHEPVGLRQVLLSELIEIVKNAMGRQSAQHLGPQHAAQHRHQQSGRNALAHHISHHQSPATPFTTTSDQLGTRRDEVVVIPSNLKRRSATCRQLHPLDDGTSIRKKLSLNLGSDAQLPIDTLMASGFLQHLVIFDGDACKISHKLRVTAMDIGPDQITIRIEHIKTPPGSTSGNNGCGEHSSLGQLSLNKAIHGEKLTVLRSKPGSLPGGQTRQPAQQLLAWLHRYSLKLISPEPTIRLKWHKNRPLHIHQTSGHHGNQFKKTVQVGETSECERQGNQQILIALLLAAEAVKQLPQRSHCLRCGVDAAYRRSRMPTGRLAAHGSAPQRLQGSNASATSQQSFHEFKTVEGPQIPDAFTSPDETNRQICF